MTDAEKIRARFDVKGLPYDPSIMYIIGIILMYEICDTLSGLYATDTNMFDYISGAVGLICHLIEFEPTAGLTMQVLQKYVELNGDK